MKLKLALATVATTFIAVPAYAQEAVNTQTRSEATTAAPSMKSMMEQCRETQREISAAKEAIQSAKNSGDAEAKRDALEKAETSLSKMSDHMTKCLGMMDMMSNMSGMMDGHDMMKGQGMMGSKNEE